MTSLSAERKKKVSLEAYMQQKYPPQMQTK